MLRSQSPPNPGQGGFLLALAFAAACCMITVQPAIAVGHWTTLSNSTPNEGGNTMYATTPLLLTDGSVMVQVGAGSNGAVNNQWDQLVPDPSSSYLGGSWNELPSMNDAREYFGSAVLPNGEVFVAGGEYSSTGKDNNTVELFDPLAGSDAWTFLSQPIEEYNKPNVWADIADAPLTVLPTGNLIMGNILYAETAIYTPASGYDYAAGAWSQGGNKAKRPNEESWVLLPGGYIVTIDCIGQPAAGPDQAELYDPNTDTWSLDGTTPAGYPVVNSQDSEIGAGILLYNGNVLFIGATGHCVLYNVASETWSPGPDLPKVIDPNPNSPTYGQSVQAVSNDAPACLEINGKVLDEASPYNPTGSGKGKGQFFFEYTPGSPGSWATVPYPTGSSPLVAITDYSCMLDLPDGNILFTDDYNTGFVYAPDSGVGSSSWAPTISNLGVNPDASYIISGTQFNGLSETTGFGDDMSNHTNYPIVQLSNDSGTYYARTFNHSTMGVQTGSEPTSTNFTFPNSVPNGEFNLSVVANGIPSDSIAFYTGIYVNGAFDGTQEGTRSNPFDTVTQGVDAAPGSKEAPSASYIFITGGDYGENPTISTPCVLINNGGGTVSIGT